MWRASSTTKSACWPTAKPAIARPEAWAPPATACSSMAVATCGWAALPSTLRSRRCRRWPYSSSINSSAALTQTWLSDPRPQRPPCCSHCGRSKMPSPRLASVLGHRPTTAPLRAAATCSAGVMCVACTRHQRASTGACSSSHCTGVWPLQARQSCTSRVCSAMWMCTGARGSCACSPATLFSRLSGGTARSECGARPSAAPWALAMGARRCSRASNWSVPRMKRACSGAGGVPKPLLW